MPFKANVVRRHHSPKQKRKLTNWAAYDTSLGQRGSLTIWFSDDAIAGWRAARRTICGGRAWYWPLAILTALTLRTVFRLALRQTESLIGSIIALPGLSLTVPRVSTLSRIEASIGRYKQVVGDGLRFHKDKRRASDVPVAVHVLNRMLELGRPISVRIK